MRNFLLALILIRFLSVSAQSFSCDGTVHLVVYNENTRESILHSLTIQDGLWQQQRTFLSERRKLTALVYNVADNFLYALDADSYEIIQIQKDGQLFSKGRPRNIDTTLQFHAGTFSPDGRGMMLISYSPHQDKNVSFHIINPAAQGAQGGAFGVTSTYPSNLADFATDPITGAMYGYDNKNRALVSVGIGGAISALNYPSTEVSDMDAVFFDRNGQLYGYAAKRGIYAMDKATGRIQFLERGPQGDYADGCSCPYTYEFNKEVIPAEILMCDTFEVKYTFVNRLGIGQAWITVVDTFPEDFEIVEIKSSIPIPAMDNTLGSNLVFFKNLIYLMGQNTIQLKIKPPDYFLGKFSSQASQYPFPLAYGSIQVSDDPMTMVKSDPTNAEIFSVNDYTLDAFMTFNCTRDSAIFTAPFEDGIHKWNGLLGSNSFSIGSPSWVELESVGRCETFSDRFDLKKFPPAAKLEILGNREILVGTSSVYTAKWSDFEPLEFYWIVNSDTLTCSDCASMKLQFSKNDTIQLVLVDEKGCALKAELPVLAGVSRKVFAPSGFTPNGDGVNDFFNLFSEMEAKADLMIFNRWGNLVFQKNQITLNQEQDGWDGGNQLMGVYLWRAHIYFSDGHQILQEGEVSLL
jgi:gliding motility-associated-like protein